MASLGIQIRKKPKILLSSFLEEERRELSEKIRLIGGILYESSNYTSCASHVICKSPSRGEKFICACAAGKWILTRDYVDESYKQKKWLDEESFEWTVAKLKQNSEQKHLFSLPRKWRLWQESGKKAVFSSWVVVLVFSNQKKRAGFKRLVEAGGGRVLTLKTPYRSIDMKKITYVISESSRAKELRTFNRAGVPILPCENIPEFIVKENVHNLADGQSSQAGEIRADVRKNKGFLATTGIAKSTRNFDRQVQKDMPKTPKRQTKLKSFFVTLQDLFEEEKKPQTFPKNEMKKINWLPTNRRVKKSELAGNLLAKETVSTICIKELNNIDNESSSKSCPQKARTLLLDSSHLSCITAEKINKQKSFDIIELDMPFFAQKDHSISNELGHSKSCNTSVKFPSVVDVPSKLKKFSFNQQRKSCTIENENVVVMPSLVKLGKKEENPLEILDIVDENPFFAVNNSVELKHDNKKGERQRKSKRVSENICLVDLTSLAPLTRNAKKKRSLGENVNVIEDKTIGLPVKKARMNFDGNISTRDVPYSFNLHCIFPWITQKNLKESIRYSLHQTGVENIEGRLEDGHLKIAMKIMSLHISQSCYLTPTLLYILLQMLKNPDESFDLTTLAEISALLNRYLSAHPPQHLRSVYQCAFRKPHVDDNGEVLETSDPFLFLMEAISDVRSQMMEGKDGVDVMYSVRREAKLTLLKFIVGVYEIDFLSFCKSSNSFDVRQNRPLLMQVLWPKSDTIGGGTLLRDFLKNAIEIALNSKDNSNLVPLRSLTFSLLQLAAGCCELSDVQCLETNYGPACTLLVSELFCFIGPLIQDKNSRHNAFHVLFNAVGPRWLAARLSDHIISLYDVSLLQAENRISLSKPLSLEKIVSCYFHLTPRFPDFKAVHTRKDGKRGKPLKLIGNSASESSRLNSDVSHQNRKLKRNSRGETQLHVACIKNQPAVVKQLLCKGVDPNLIDNAGWTALHEASNHGNKECVAELLKCRDLNIYATAMNGVSALHDAVANNHCDVVKLLLRSGGTQLLGMKTDLHKSAFDLASTTAMKTLLKSIDISETVQSSLCNPENKCSPEDIEDYLLLLLVLLGYFSCPEKSVPGQFKAYFKDLQDHVLRLCTYQNAKILNLLGMLRMFLSS